MIVQMIDATIAIVVTKAPGRTNTIVTRQNIDHTLMEDDERGPMSQRSSCAGFRRCSVDGVTRRNLTSLVLYER